MSRPTVRSGIEEADAEIDGTMDGADRFIVIDLSPAKRYFACVERAADRPAAHAEPRNLASAPETDGRSILGFRQHYTVLDLLLLKTK
jgi:hypothetical protein